MIAGMTQVKPIRKQVALDQAEVANRGDDKW